jgi:hypothetical protein
MSNHAFTTMPDDLFETGMSRHGFGAVQPAQLTWNAGR